MGETNRGDMINDKYELVKILGSGTYGEVWLVADITDRRTEYAMKIPKEEIGMNVGRDVMRENIILAECDHPNIAKAKEILYSSKLSRFCTVLPLADGSLRLYMTEKTPLDTKYHAIKQILCGLEYLNVKGIVHADIKPDNILVYDDGVVTIADFGISVFCSATWRCVVSNEIVTATYRPPELVKARSIRASHKVDMWSFGCVLYEILARDLLIRITDIDDLSPITNFTITDTIRNRMLTNSPYDDVLTRIFAGCMNKDPDARFTATQCLDLMNQDEFRIEREINVSYPVVKDPNSNKRYTVGNTIANYLQDDGKAKSSAILLLAMSIYDRLMELVQNERCKLLSGKTTDMTKAIYYISDSVVSDKDIYAYYSHDMSYDKNKANIVAWTILILDKLKFNLHYPSALTMAFEYDKTMDRAATVIVDVNRHPAIEEHITYRTVAEAKIADVD
uniref:Protein kinase domain-containing protein n=1 Tax=viral metagenome TaxID=1070528 RepID=A0A6C0LY62_9ZZZZ